MRHEDPDFSRQQPRKSETRLKLNGLCLDCDCSLNYQTVELHPILFFHRVSYLPYYIPPSEPLPRIHLRLLPPLRKGRRIIRAGTSILHDILRERCTCSGHRSSSRIGDTHQEDSTTLCLSEDDPERSVTALGGIEAVRAIPGATGVSGYDVGVGSSPAGLRVWSDPDHGEIIDTRHREIIATSRLREEVSLSKVSARLKVLSRQSRSEALGRVLRRLCSDEYNEGIDHLARKMPPRLLFT